jgi:putative ABC transport system permease protein
MRKWLSTLHSVWTGLSTHKLRSFLTMLGIVIGVASVITLMSIGKGATASILENIQSMGSNLINITPGSSTYGGMWMGGAQTLSYEDGEAIQEQVKYIDSLAPYSSTYTQLIYKRQNTYAQVTGTTPAYQQVNTIDLDSGLFFTESDMERGARVAVIGSEIAETLFVNTNPIGEQLRVNNIIFTVIGVTKSEGGWMGTDNSIIIPFTTFEQTLSQTRTSRGEHVVSTISLTVTNEDRTDAVIEEITSLLRNRHRLTVGTGDDFTIQSMQEIVEAMEETSQTLTLLLGAIAAIALLVGGIGVMNIMLVSVLERTREIGIRKALGARESDIWVQFLIEAATLTLAGGIIGVIIGWVASILINNSGFMTTLVSADIVIMAVSVSIGIGLFFGFYPAWNASRLNPIEALRSE